MSLSIDQVLNLLRTEQPISALPFGLKGGETWIFKAEGAKSQDWRADGHRWINQGTVGLPRKNPRLKKKYFYIQTEKGASKEFVKYVFHPPDCTNGPFCIQYIGNDQVSQPMSHGNSKTEDRTYIRTKPSSLDKWLTQTRTEDPNLVYKKEVQQEEMPRNLKQIQNLRYKGNNDLRISRDALYNIHALARDTSNTFIHLIHTFPNLVVICGHSLMFEELERVLYLDTEIQCLSYDTTFQLGDFYVSVLIFRHIIFKECPCMPALFMIHQRKYQKHHEILFNFFKDTIRLPKSQLACVTDGESGIINAMTCISTLIDLRCWNHVLNDIQRWQTDHGFSKAEITGYKDHIRFIFGRDTREASMESYDTLKEAWEVSFIQYFEERILPNLGKCSKWGIEAVTKFDPYSGITQNQSESMNKLLKSLNKWKEVPVDVVILSFLRLHQYYLKEISRGRAGLGTYTLKPQYISARIDMSEVTSFSVCQPEEIVSAIRENQFTFSSTQAENEIDESNIPKVDINVSRAEELIKNDRIVFAPKLGTFTIVGQNDKPRVVTVFPVSCSCGAHGCYHLAAVKKSLGMDIRQKNTPNLTTLRKLDEKKKAGRKRPRIDDYDYPTISDDVTAQTSQIQQFFSTVAEDADIKPVTNIPADIITEEKEPEHPSSLSGPDWIEIGNITLKDEEQSILKSPIEWLNDRIIDASMALIKRQFPYIWGLESCLNAGSRHSFSRAHGNFIQIINRDPKHGGSHWLTLSSMKTKSKSEVKIYDSGFTSVSFSVQESICHIMKKGTPPKKNDKICLNLMDCAFQENGNDCGLYAIANAVAEANGVDPCTQLYNKELMRGHLFSCLEKGRIIPFPANTRVPVSTGIRYTVYLKVFCSCRMPEAGSYVICSKCGMWWHPECEGLDEKDIPADNIPYYCKKCVSSKVKFSKIKR